MTATVFQLDPRRVQPPHDVEDDTKLDDLVGSMRRAGWQGAPIVVVLPVDTDPVAVTGSHRVAAAREAGIEVHAVDLAELATAFDMDLAELIQERLDALFDDHSAICDAAMNVAQGLPADMRDYYGLDLH